MTRLGYSQANIATQVRLPGPRLLIGVIALTLVAIPALESGAQALEPSAEMLETAETAERVAAGMPLLLIENRRMLSYPMDHVWPTAIRYLRIDRGFEITDRDRDAGYLLFEFPLEEKRIGSGSVEMFEAIDASGRASVSIGVNTGAGPVHLPNSILDGIAAKVRAERGQPAPPPPPKQEEPPPKKDKPDDDHSVPLLPPAIDPDRNEFE
jgi:hypothetical protein